MLIRGELKCRSMMLMILVAVLLMWGVPCAAISYDWTAGNTSVWLSATAYCKTSSFSTRVFKGYSSGFIVTKTIDEEDEGVQVK